MKYLIEDTENFTLGEIQSYFQMELLKTNLKKEDIKVSKKLKLKIGMKYIEDIFSDNGINDINISGCYVEFNFTGHNILISKKEIMDRFDYVFESMLITLKDFKQ